MPRLTAKHKKRKNMAQGERKEDTEYIKKNKKNKKKEERRKEESQDERKNR